MVDPLALARQTCPGYIPFEQPQLGSYLDDRKVRGVNCPPVPLAFVPLFSSVLGQRTIDLETLNGTRDLVFR